VLAELLVREGYQVILVTPAGEVSSWARNTLEQEKIQTRLLELGVDIRAHRAPVRVMRGGVEIACTFTGKTSTIPGDSVVMVTARMPRDELYLALTARREDWTEAGIQSVKLIGDAQAPGTIAAAVYAGHRYAQEMDAPDIGDALPFKRDIAELAPL
jgi:dimethylamine/trimethylamine dehydrogenase